MIDDESRHWDDEKLEREEGVFTPGIAGASAGCDQASDDCALAEDAEDPLPEAPDGTSATGTDPETG